MKAKPYDIQWPVTGKTIEDINANFDALFHSLSSVERTVATSKGLHEILSSIHSDTLTANRLRGDILTAQGVNPKWARLAKGALATVLTMGASEPAWAVATHVVLGAVHTDTLAGTVVRGDVIIGNATPKWSRLAKGIATYVLTAGASDVSWAILPTQTSALLSAVHTDTTPAAVVRGDLIVGIGVAPTWSRLAKGTAGHFLKQGTNEPAWTGIVWADVDKTTSSIADLTTRHHTSLDDVSANQHHAQAHVLDGADHSVSGLTAGHFLKALTATTFGFAAHGLSYGDVGAAPANHSILSATHGDSTAAAVVRGDLIVGIGATPKWERVAAGTLAHVLTMGATEPAWAVIPTQTSALLSAVHTDTLADTVIRGDLVVGNATPKWARLAKGTASYVLTMGADDPAWAALPAAGAHVMLSATHTDSTAAAAVRGDIIIASGASPLWTRLAIGTAGYVLKAGANEPAWGTLASTSLSDTANLVRLDAANSFSLINPLTTIAESWIGPSSTTGIYFKGGNVGIGTTTPGVPFDLYGPNAADIMLVRDAAAPTNYFGFGVNRAGGGYNDIFSIISGAWGNLIFQRGGGKVGIRTTVVNATLEVKGDIFFTDPTGVGFIHFLPGAAAAAIYSDYYSGTDLPLELGTYTKKTAVTIQGTSGIVTISTLGAFATGDKYVIADGSGNLHVSTLGPLA